MKFRSHTPDPTEASLREAEESLQAMLRARGYTEPSRLPDPVRSAMLVRTNERIDRATSGRALSLSWAVRVAVPGVVAIIAFFVGLHYYGTPASREPGGMVPFLSDLTDGALDSLMELHAVIDSTALADHAGDGLFDIPGDLAADYLLATDPDLVAETLDEQQVQQVLTALTTDRGAAF